MGGRGNRSGMTSSNTSNRTPMQLNANQTRAVRLAERQLSFDRGYAEITQNQWSNVNMSNQRMANALTANSNRYSYEYRTETEAGNFWTGGTPITHHRIYRNRK